MTYYDHGPICTPLCRQLAVPSPLDRPHRPPAVPCPHCGAPAGVACELVGPGRRRPLTVFGRFHPSRMEIAA